MSNSKFTLEVLTASCDYLGIFPNSSSVENATLLIIGEISSFGVIDSILQNSWQIIGFKDNGFTLMKDNEIKVKDQFFERVLDRFPANNIHSVLWIHNDDEIYETRLVVEKFQKRFPNLNKLIFIEHREKDTLEMEMRFDTKVQIIEDTFGSCSLSGRIYGKNQIDFDFKNIFNELAHPTSSYELAVECFQFSLWGQTEIGFSKRIQEATKINALRKSVLKESLDNFQLLRQLAAKDYEIFDLRNQLRAISTLTEIREDNTEGMKFRIKKDSSLNRLLKTQNKGARGVYKLLPQRLQIIIRLIRNKYLRNR
jgi:hypothetical protein